MKYAQTYSSKGFHAVPGTNTTPFTASQFLLFDEYNPVKKLHFCAENAKFSILESTIPIADMTSFGFQKETRRFELYTSNSQRPENHQSARHKCGPTYTLTAVLENDSSYQHARKL